MTAAGRFRSRRHTLLQRIILHGLTLLAVSGLTFALMGRIFLRSALDRDARPFARWVVAQLCTHRQDPTWLHDEKNRFPATVSLYALDGSLLEAVGDPPWPQGPPKPFPRPAEEVVWNEKNGAVFLIPCRSEGGDVVAYGVTGPPSVQISFGLMSATFGALLVGLALASIPLARSIAAPLEQLVTAVQAFGAGHLAVRAKLSRRDEIGDLSRAFDAMAERLQRLVHAEKELLANVSHELRTPLARIRVVLETVQEDPVSAQRYLPEIGRDLAELERLVEDVLTAARLEMTDEKATVATLPLRRRTIFFDALLDQSVARFGELWPTHSLKLTMAAPLPSLHADGSLLRRVVDNLLDNAAKYSEPEQAIALVASTQDDDVVLEVIDQGLGIAPAELPHVFTPFFRGDRSRSRGTGGVGLGLALAQRIVVAHGGIIALRSQPGAGTTVTVTLPVVPSDLPA